MFQKLHLPTNISASTAKDLVEIFGKIAIGCGVLCYIFGLIVVNIYLSKYGIHSLSLFRLSYVAAGLWALFLIVLPAFIFVSVILLIYGNVKGITEEVRYTKFEIEPGNPEPVLHTEIEHEQIEPKPLNIFIGSTILLMLLYAAYGLYPILNDESWTSLLSTLGLSALFILTLFVCVLLGIEESNSYSRIGRILLAGLLALTALVFYLNQFATGLYGQIPSYIGGGAPESARLVLPNDEHLLESLREIGILFDPASLTYNVQVLLVTDEEYVLLVQATDKRGLSSLKTLSLSKDSVKAVVNNDPLFGVIIEPVR